MFLAPVHTTVDAVSGWQATNGVAYCERLRATITQKHCNRNRYFTKAPWSDLRCNGCGGLNNQTTPQIPETLLALDADKTIDLEKATPSGSVSTDSQNDDYAALDEIINQHFENPAAADDFDDVELDLDDGALSSLFPALYEGDDEYFPAFKEYQKPMPVYAVYKGRCKKCGGYVDNIREEHDDNVFRCLACGWRTGPEYQENRLLYAAGKDGKGNQDDLQLFAAPQAI